MRPCVILLIQNGNMTDFNEPVPKAASEKRFCPGLDTYKAGIDKWLETDDAPRKQRHTARRVFKRLKEEFSDFDCSYRTVAAYYAVKHKEVFSGSRVGFLPLEHHPGDAQVDFGTADFYENGRRITGKYLDVSFPYSNKGYLQLFYGENTMWPKRMANCSPATDFGDPSITIFQMAAAKPDRSAPPWQ